MDKDEQLNEDGTSDIGNNKCLNLSIEVSKTGIDSHKCTLISRI